MKTRNAPVAKRRAAYTVNTVRCDNPVMWTLLSLAASHNARPDSDQIFPVDEDHRGDHRVVDNPGEEQPCHSIQVLNSTRDTVLWSEHGVHFRFPRTSSLTAPTLGAPGHLEQDPRIDSRRSPRVTCTFLHP